MHSYSEITDISLLVPSNRWYKQGFSRITPALPYIHDMLILPSVGLRIKYLGLDVITMYFLLEKQLDFRSCITLNI